MKILIVGATGRTGQQLLDQALAQGHDVAVFVRTPEAFAQHPQRARLRIAQGNVLDGSAVETAVSGQDAVLCALGPRKGAPDTDLTTGTVNIVRAMEKAGVRQLIFLSGHGVGDSVTHTPFIFGKVIIPLFLRGIYEEKAHQEAAIRGSTLDWVIVRPTRLTNGPLLGTCRIIENYAGMSAKISRADLAAFMLAQLTSDQYLHRAPGITN